MNKINISINGAINLVPFILIISLLFSVIIQSWYVINIFKFYNSIKILKNRYGAVNHCIGIGWQPSYINA